MAGLLIPEARHFILPSGIKSTEGPSLNGICSEVGVPLAEWQRSLSMAAGAKSADGLYAAETIVVSIPRQAGKTHWARAYVFAQCIKHSGTTVAWTAHHTKVAAESFAALKTLATSEKVAPHVQRIVGARGSEAIEFVNGSRILMAAREKAGIRGFAKIRILVLDEAQILSEAAMSDMVPTLNQATNPQIIMMGTPPRPQDRGDVFTNRRDEALAAQQRGEAADSVLYFETSADADAETDDHEQWRLANPSFPKFTPVKAMQRMRRELSEDDYRREALGIWDDKGAAYVITPDEWAVVSDTASVPSSRFVLAIDVDPAQSCGSVAFAGLRPDGRVHVELDEQRRGVGWIAPYVAGVYSRNEIAAVVIDAKSPAASLLEDFRRLKVHRLVQTGADEMATACAQFFQLATEDGLRHIDQPQLNISLASARKRSLGDRWAWNRKTADADITPIVAATLAVWGAKTKRVRGGNAAPDGRPGRRVVTW